MSLIVCIFLLISQFINCFLSVVYCINVPINCLSRLNHCVDRQKLVSHGTNLGILWHKSYCWHSVARILMLVSYLIGQTASPLNAMEWGLGGEHLSLWWPGIPLPCDYPSSFATLVTVKGHGLLAKNSRPQCGPIKANPRLGGSNSRFSCLLLVSHGFRSTILEIKGTPQTIQTHTG